MMIIQIMTFSPIFSCLLIFVKSYQMLPNRNKQGLIIVLVYINHFIRGNVELNYSLFEKKKSHVQMELWK